MHVKTGLRAAALLAALLVGSHDTPAEGNVRNPTGYFEGTAKTKQTGTLDVTLNLRRINGRYEGELTTPVGDFAVTAGSFQDGRLRLRLRAGAATLTVEARVEAGGLHGTFRSGDDSGPIQLRRVGDAKARPPQQPTLKLRPEEWREDLRYFARELPKRHANAFHHISRQRFEAEVRDLDRRLGRLGGEAVYVVLDRIANLVGDAHTYVRLPHDVARLPLALGKFGDEYRVVAVAPGLEKTLGAIVLKVGNLPITRARTLVLPLTPQDETPALAEARATNFLTIGLVLHGLGIIPDRKAARYTLADDAGRQFTVTVRALAPGAKPRWVTAYRKPPLFRHKPDQSFWYVYLPDSKAVYCGFRGYDDLAASASGLWQLVRERQPDKLDGHFTSP